MSEKINIQIQKRSWYEWLLWTLWLLLEVFLFQNAVMSSAELQSTASTIFWISFLVVLGLGATVFFLRRKA